MAQFYATPPWQRECEQIERQKTRKQQRRKIEKTIARQLQRLLAEFDKLQQLDTSARD